MIVVGANSLLALGETSILAYILALTLGRFGACLGAIVHFATKAKIHSGPRRELRHLELNENEGWVRDAEVAKGYLLAALRRSVRDNIV